MEDKATLYLETSVISYLVGRLHSNAVTLAYQQITREWWETERKDYKCFVSTLVLEEIGEGDPVLSGQREELVNNIDVLDVASEVPELAQIYFESPGPT